MRAKLARKEKIPGFGHRVPFTEDPRATHLRQMSKDPASVRARPSGTMMSQRIEALVKTEKKLNPNVDFYWHRRITRLVSRPIFHADLAVSRISGWTAHVLEQHANNRPSAARGLSIGPEPRSATCPSRAASPLSLRNGPRSLTGPRPSRTNLSLASLTVPFEHLRP